MSDKPQGGVARWWDGREQESFWLEATDRLDIGADLRAPDLDGGGRPNWRYDLFKMAKIGDVVLHYDKKPSSQGIVGFSKVSGPWHTQPIVWAARGSYARGRGDVPIERPGFVVPISDFTPVPTISLTRVREHKDALNALLTELKLGLPRDTPLYFPFETSSSRELRLLQGYAWKLPAGFLSIFPELRGLARPSKTTSILLPSSSTTGSRNPPWSRDELILALDLYVRTAGTSITHGSPEIVELSELLNQLNVALGPTAAISQTYRNPNGVYMKLMNFRRFDPSFTQHGRVGLSRGNNLEGILWGEHSSDPARLNAVAEAIRAALSSGQLQRGPGILDDGDDEALEGRILTRLHRFRERDAGLSRRRKEQALRQHGHLACEACGFDFGRTYGDRGEGYIECHHTKPLHTLGTSTPTRMSDLALLCANCHRMIHSRQPWLTINQLRACMPAW